MLVPSGPKVLQSVTSFEPMFETIEKGIIARRSCSKCTASDGFSAQNTTSTIEKRVK